MEFNGFRSISQYESECARFGYTTRRVPFHGPEGACFVLFTAPPGHPSGTSVQAWNLFTADETKELLDGVVSGGAFFKAHADERGPGYIRDGLDVNFLGKLYAHGYYPDNFEDVRAIAQGEPVSIDHPVYDRYPDKKRERLARERVSSAAQPDKTPDKTPQDPAQSAPETVVAYAPEPAALDISADGQLRFLF
jgi:hypothetical protein